MSVSRDISGSKARVFISYRSKDPDQGLARLFFDKLAESGHIPFMAGESISLGEGWSERVDRELEACDYFLLLLSPKAASSEMVTEEVRRARELREGRPDRRPGILPIRLQFPMEAELNYDLRGYLNRIQQATWESEEDTPRILQQILNAISQSSVPDEIPLDEAPSVSATPVFYGPNGRPLPIAEPEIPGGQMELASKFYIKREPYEERCKQAIARPAGLVRIKAPRQMGKTSLMARILHDAQQKQYRTASITFQLMEERVQKDLDRFFLRFCALVSRDLELSRKQLKDYWDENVDLFGPKDCCTDYFEEYVLADLNSPLVLGLDEVDRLFPYKDVAEEFLSLLRAWNEKGKNSSDWAKLRIIVVHSTESYVALDTNQSPFNVGLAVELPEFTADQVLELARRHGLDWSQTEVEPLMEMVGGHPYLIRLGLYRIAQQDLTLAELLEEAPTEAGLYGDHLRRHLWNLEKHPSLLEAVKRTAATEAPVTLESDAAFKLHGMGLMDLDGNAVSLRCNLYRQYFRKRLRVR